MKWEEVRELYPNQYVLIRILDSHREGNKEIVDDVALERNISDPEEATNQLVRSKGNMLLQFCLGEKIFYNYTDL